MTELDKVAKILNKAGIVIFPTETVFGIGCLLTKTDSIEKLYQIKQRDLNKPSLVLVKDLSQAKDWVSFNRNAEKLADYFWPGPLTISLPVKRNVSKLVLGPSDTLGVRVSSHPFLTALLPLLEAPLLAPSANLQGQKPPSAYSEIDKKLISLVDYVVDIAPEAKKPSTIVTFDQEKYNVLREGDISSEAINKVLITKE